ALMEPDSKAQDHRKAIGVAQVSDYGQRFLAPLQRLVRIAKKPQRPGRPGEAHCPGVEEEGMGPVLLRVIESNALFCLRSGSNQLTKVKQGSSQRPVSL